MLLYLPFFFFNMKLMLPSVFLGGPFWFEYGFWLCNLCCQVPPSMDMVINILNYGTYGSTMVMVINILKLWLYYVCYFLLASQRFINTLQLT